MFYFCGRYSVCLVSGCILLSLILEAPRDRDNLCVVTQLRQYFKNSIQMGFLINCTDGDLLKILREVKAKWHKS